jgi:acetyl-CoA/propionyl-CoA carboxylase carboxyl transferase subunit
MNSRSLGATRVFAWPDAEVAVMGATAAVRILHRRKLAEVPDEDRGAAEAALAEQHERESGGVRRACDLGLVDEIIDADHTRSAVAAALSDRLAPRGLHGNIPL